MATYYVTTSGSDSNSGLSEALAFATPGYAAGVMSASGGDTVYIKSGTYLLSTTTTNVSGGRVQPAAGVSGAPNRVIGYLTTPGDLDGDSDFSNYPILRATSSGNDVPFSFNNGYIWASNLIGDCDGHAGYGFNATGNRNIYANLKSVNATFYGMNCNNVAIFYRCWVTGTGQSCSAGWYTTSYGGAMIACRIDGIPNVGLILDDARIVVAHCLIANNTGASADGIRLTTGDPHSNIIGCTIHGNGRDGIRANGSGSFNINMIKGNLITSNGGYGINSAVTTYSINYPSFGRNFFRSNTSGDYSGVVAGIGDVDLTADPYTNAAGGDFSLNNTAGGGAACRGAGMPYNLPGETTRTNFSDGGAYQSQGSGGSSTVYQVISPGIIWGTS